MRRILFIVVAFGGCTDQKQPAEGPPFVDDAESLGNGKADGGFSLGTASLVGQQSGYRSDTMPISCTQGGKVALDVTYVNTSLPWGVTVQLWRGMSGEEWCGGCEPAYDYFYDWNYQQNDGMHATAPYTWSAHTESYGYEAGAGGRFISTKLVFKITMPDGSTKWDNGGSNWGYYEAKVPDPQCDASWTPYQVYDSPVAPLPLSVVSR